MLRRMLIRYLSWLSKFPFTDRLVVKGFVLLGGIHAIVMALLPNINPQEILRVCMMFEFPLLKIYKIGSFSLRT